MINCVETQTKTKRNESQKANCDRKNSLNNLNLIKFCSRFVYPGKKTIFLLKKVDTISSSSLWICQYRSDLSFDVVVVD